MLRSSTCSSLCRSAVSHLSSGEHDGCCLLGSCPFDDPFLEHSVYIHRINRSRCTSCSVRGGVHRADFVVNERSLAFGRACIPGVTIRHVLKLREHFQNGLPVLLKLDKRLYVLTPIILEYFLVHFLDIVAFCHLFQAVEGRVVVYSVY